MSTYNDQLARQEGHSVRMTAATRLKETQIDPYRACEAVAEYEQRRRSAVVRPQAGVFLGASAELGKHQHGNVGGAADPLQVLEKSAYCVGRVHQQPGVKVRLRSGGNGCSNRLVR